MAWPDYDLGSSGSEQKLSAVERTVEVSYEQIGEELRLADGSLAQDITATKRRWKISFDWLHGDTANVLDGGMGRDDLLALYAGASTYSFKVPQEDGTQATYTVAFVMGSWQERRLLAGSEWVWQVSFELAEV